MTPPRPPHGGATATQPVPPSLLAQQHALVQALWRRPPAQATAVPTRAATPVEAPPRGPEIESFFRAINPYGTCAEGLKTYQNNAQALARRVLLAAHPVLTELMSADSMAALAVALWHHHPPRCGDLAHWGGELAGFMRASDQLTDWPWLADVARLEWALHQADTAADVPANPASLALLAQTDPDALTLQLAAGARVLRLDHAVADVVRAGGQLPPNAPAPPPQAQWVGVWRPLGKPQFEPLDDATAGFLRHLLEGRSLLAALDAHPIDLPEWLPAAVRRGWVVGVRPMGAGG